MHRRRPPRDASGRLSANAQRAQNDQRRLGEHARSVVADIDPIDAGGGDQFFSAALFQFYDCFLCSVPWPMVDRTNFESGALFGL